MAMTAEVPRLDGEKEQSESSLFQREREEEDEEEDGGGTAKSGSSAGSAPRLLSPPPSPLPLPPANRGPGLAPAGSPWQLHPLILPMSSQPAAPLKKRRGNIAFSFSSTFDSWCLPGSSPAASFCPSTSTYQRAFVASCWSRLVPAGSAWRLDGTKSHP